MEIVGPFPRNKHVTLDETRLLLMLLGEKPSGSVMIDVGAHYGSSLTPFLRKSWKVFAFEPDPQNRNVLQSRLGQLTNLFIDERALSDSNHNNVPFFRSNQSTGISSLSAFHPSHTMECSVVTTTLRNFAIERGLTHIDVLKIDTEGYDLMVLKGVPWDTIKPETIICEFENKKTLPLGYDAHDLAQFLIEKGYTVITSEWYPIIQYGIAHDWRCLSSYPCDMDSNGWGNFIAFLIPPSLQSLKKAARRNTFAPASRNVLTRLLARGVKMLR